MVNRALYVSVFFRTCNTTIRFVSRKTDDSKSGVASMNSASRNLDNQLKTRRKVAKMLIAVVIMFSINFFPVHFLPVLQVLLCSESRRETFLGQRKVLNRKPEKQGKLLSFATAPKVCHKFFSDMSPFQFIVDKTVEDEGTLEKFHLFFQTSAIITHCLCYFNSAINPIIYYFMSAQFKVKPFSCLESRQLSSFKTDGFPIGQSGQWIMYLCAFGIITHLLLTMLRICCSTHWLSYA